MAMSGDRVKFTIPVCRLTTSSQAISYRKVCKEVFGLHFASFPESGYEDCVTIICRPSQFARFLIARHREGVQNMFSELNPVLFTPKNYSSEFDVSEHPARKC